MNTRKQKVFKRKKYWKVHEYGLFTETKQSFHCKVKKELSEFPNLLRLLLELHIYTNFSKQWSNNQNIIQSFPCHANTNCKIFLIF